MRRTLGLAVLAAGLLVAAQPGAAQWTVGAGASAIIPTGDFGDYAKTGWGVAGTLGRAINEDLSFVAVGSYGTNDHDDAGDPGAKTNLIGFSGNLVYYFGDATARPFIFGGAGVLGHQYKSDNFPDEESTDWNAAFNGGAGLSFPLGSLGGYVLGNYVYGLGDEKTTYFAVGGGIVIPIGGDGM
jgi:hypothetical protein